MSSYIRSNSNRFYAGIESYYGEAAQVTTTDRFPALRVRAQQSVESATRLDKTGTRTLAPTPRDGKRRTAFEIRTYLSSMAAPGQVPYGVLFQSAMGAEPEVGQGLVVGSSSSAVTFSTTTPHGWSVGSAVSTETEIRFVTSVIDPQQVTVNAPFGQSLDPGMQLNPTTTYRLATDLPSLSIYDYWDPITAVSRIITGAAVDILQLSINGDRHEITFTGPAANLIDSVSFSSGTAGLNSFPYEPPIQVLSAGPVPGHLGQAWLGVAASQFFTVTEATIRLHNNIELRNQEFGSSYPLAAIPGQRQVSTKFSLFAQDDSQTLALYSAAKNRTSISMMLQMGKQKGQLLGAYLPSVLPVMPSFDDSETRLTWQFESNLAEGTSDDELYIAFA